MNNEKNTLIARRYAQSLIEIGKSERLNFNDILTDLSKIRKILDRSPDLYRSLVNPLVSVHDKVEVIEEVFQKDSNEIIRNFLKVLVEKNRFDVIFEVIEEYILLVDIFEGLDRAEVISAVELNADEKDNVEKALNAKFNKEMIIKYSTDSSIIAGLVVKMGDNVIDMSVAHKLEQYKMALTK